MAIDIESIFADKFLDLSKDNNLKNVTIKELLQETGASKQTFYNHFMDKDDLICWIYEHRILSSFHDKTLKMTYYMSVLDYLNRIAKYYDFMRQAVELTGQNSLTDFMKRYSAEYDISWQKVHCNREYLTEEELFALEYHSIANMEMTIRWIKNGMPETPEFMAKQATVLRRIGLGPLFYEGDNAKKYYDGI